MLHDDDKNDKKGQVMGILKLKAANLVIFAATSPEMPSDRCH